MHIWKKHKICRKNTSVQCRVHRLLPIKYHTKHYVLLTDTLSPARFGWVWRTVASDSFSWRERNPIWSSAVVACLPRGLMCSYTVNSFPTKILRRNTRLPFLLILHFAESSLAFMAWALVWQHWIIGPYIQVCAFLNHIQIIWICHR